MSCMTSWSCLSQCVTACLFFHIVYRIYLWFSHLLYWSMLTLAEIMVFKTVRKIISSKIKNFEGILSTVVHYMTVLQTYTDADIALWGALITPLILRTLHLQFGRAICSLLLSNSFIFSVARCILYSQIKMRWVLDNLSSPISWLTPCYSLWGYIINFGNTAYQSSIDDVVLMVESE